MSDNSESSFKVAEEPGKSKPYHKFQGKATVSTEGKFPVVDLARPPELHTTGKTNTHLPSTVHERPHSLAKTAEFNGSVLLPYHIQTHINVTNQNSHVLVSGLPIRLHVHPDLPLPTRDGHQQVAVLSKQQAYDLSSSKASTIHNDGTFQWGPFSKCTVTCGSGVRKRYRRCSAEDCTAPGIQTQVVPCASTCSGTLCHCFLKYVSMLHEKKRFLKVILYVHTSKP